MPTSSREIVKACLNFKTPPRIPRDIWVLPCFIKQYKEKYQTLLEKYPPDFCTAPYIYEKSQFLKGNPFEIGIFIDEWNCEFKNIHEGIIGEVKKPLLENIYDIDKLIPPYDILPDNLNKAKEIVNNACKETDKFIMAACCPRPWERYQFIRGTENAMMDLILYPEATEAIIKKIHEFYMKELEFWVSTDVDAIPFMDDWGSQRDILISPKMWRKYFKPLYKDYCEIAHKYDKYVFMHSDGCINKIYEDLIEIGVNAINSQLFCMDMKELSQKAKGKITFWGEIDRQHILPDKDTNTGRKAVRKVAENLYDKSGGIIAQFELGPGANPDAGFAIMDEWEKIAKENC